jgi:ElaB/YqjD/DUF883 family membrane-anchored ribosome-binding protein
MTVSELQRIRLGKLEQEIQKLKEEFENLVYDHDESMKLIKNLKQKLEKMLKELQRRIDEETKHINHPKQIYRLVEHNCKYNLRVCEILKEMLEKKE